MSYLLDTDVVVAYLKGRQPEITLLATLKPAELSICLITYGEIYEGIYYGRNSQTSEKGFRLFLRDVDVLPLTRLIMRRFARIRGQLRHSGTLISDNDILIGATALQHNLTLVTHNKKHFQRISNLVIY